jgi:hypothetical protein
MERLEIEIAWCRELLGRTPVPPVRPR